MEVVESSDQAQQLKRKRLEDLDESQSIPGEVQNRAIDTTVDGQAQREPDANSPKRIKVGENNGHIQSYSRLDIPEDKSNLPGALWQYIFTFLPPPTLTRLLAVNHGFKELLTRIKSEDKDTSSIGPSFKHLDSDSIWCTSRRCYFPNMPRPLAQQSELATWQLISGRSCQFCRKKRSPEPCFNPDHPWSGGPGADGVRIIWPFGVRSCAECLTTRMKKEMDIMFSSSIPSALLPALPFGFFTSALDYISPISLQAGSPPQGTIMSKYFFQDHLDEIKQKFEEVRLLGGSTAEEWFKGLEGTGKDRLADALRWERWDAEGGIQKLHTFRVARIKAPEVPTGSPVKPPAPSPALSQVPAPVLMQPNPAVPPGLPAPVTVQPMLAPPMPSPISFPSHFSSTPFYPGPPPGVSQPGYQHLTGPPVIQPPPAYLPPKPSTPMTPMNPMTPAMQIPGQFQPQHAPPRPPPMTVPIQPHMPQPRAERNIRDVNEAKAQRRAQIERKCMELDPPINPSTLIHMESFAAAIQIPMALTDGAWEVLKPRLLAQRETAESREKEQLQQSQLLHARTEERRQQEAALREAKENMDRQWDESQKPLRDKLNYYADEILRLQWDNGERVGKDNCAQFAADVLLYVRRRFYQMQAWEDGLMNQQGMQIRQDLQGAGSGRKLTLENMKWVFDMKIKPLTESHSKEIFLCNGCDNNTKFYGFEGVIQHYAAKHTSVLSMGSIVVHWKADWPEDPPFDPNPDKALATVPPQHLTQLSPPGMHGQDVRYQVSRQISPPSLQSQPQYAAGAVYRPIQVSSTERPSSQYATSPVGGGFQLQSAGSMPPYRQPPFFGNGVSQQSPQFAGQAWSPSSHSPADIRSALSANSPHQPGAMQSSWPPSQTPQQRPRPTPSVRLGPPGQPFGIYQVQLEEVSKNSREIFEATAAVKDFPSSVRLHVIISHVVLRFKDRFTNEPTLSLFTDALNNSSQMKPLRNMGDLACKTCAISRSELNAAPAGSPTESEKQELYTLPALLTHFQSVHIEQARPAMVTHSGIETPRTDWKFDMIKLPSNPEIAKLIDAPGMTDAKLKIVATILPWVFPTPLPEIGYREPYIDPSDVKPTLSEAASSYSTIPAALNNHRQVDMQATDSVVKVNHESGGSGGLEVAVDDFPKFVESPMREPAFTAEPAREDEYDPHRPAYIEPTADSYSRYDHSKTRSKDPRSVLSQPNVLPNGYSTGIDRAPIGNDFPAYMGRPSQNRQGMAVHTPQQQRGQSIGAAEQFLNNFDPNEDRDTYEPPEHVSPVLNPPSEPMAQYHQPYSQPTSARNSSWDEGPRRVSELDRHRRRYEATEEMRTNNVPFGSQPSRDAGLVEYGRYGKESDNVYYVGQPPPRSPSHFHQYVNDAPELLRTRSRSPPTTQSVPSTSRYYRARSPIRETGPMYGSQQYIREPEYSPQNDKVHFVPETHRQPHADRGYGGAGYEGPVEYIRMPPREAHEPTTYYVERHGPPSGQYVQYEEPVFEHNGQLYRRSQVPPNAPVERQYYR